MSQSTPPPIGAESTIQTIKSKHEQICLALNMDSETSRLSWENYEQQAGTENLLEVSTELNLFNFFFEKHIGLRWIENTSITTNSSPQKKINQFTGQSSSLALLCHLCSMP